MSSLREECRGFLISSGIIKIYICFQNPVTAINKNPENNKKFLKLCLGGADFKMYILRSAFLGA